MDGDGDLNPTLDCEFKEAHEKIRVLLKDLLVKIPSELRADCEKLHLEVLWHAECMFKHFLIQMMAESKQFFEDLKRKMLTQLKSDEEIRKVRDEIVALLRSEFIQDCNFNSKATRDGDLDAILDCKFNDLYAMLDCKVNEVHEKFNEVHEKMCLLLKDLLVKIPSEVRADCEKLHLEVLWQVESMFNQFLIQMAADFKKFFEEEKREMLMQLKGDEEIRKMREEIVAQLRSEIKQDQDRKGFFEEIKREMLTRLKNDEELRKRCEEIVALMRSGFKQEQSCVIQSHESHDQSVENDCCSIQELLLKSKVQH